MGDLVFVKNLIKFLTFAYYHELENIGDNLWKIEFRMFVGTDDDYYDTFSELYSFLSIYKSNIEVIYNKFGLKAFSLSTFKKRKKEIYNVTNDVYLLSLKDEQLIPYKMYKTKKFLANDMLSLQSRENTVYAMKLADIRALIESYFKTLKEAFQVKKINNFEVLHLLEKLFQTTDTYFDKYKDLHFVLDYVFSKNYEVSESYLDELRESIDSNLDEQFNLTIQEINKSLTKTVSLKFIKNNRFSFTFKQRHNKDVEDVLCELKLCQDGEVSGEHFVFRNMKKFSIQDFILYLTILNNLLASLLLT